MTPCPTKHFKKFAYGQVLLLTPRRRQEDKELTNRSFSPLSTITIHSKKLDNSYIIFWKLWLNLLTSIHFYCSATNFIQKR